MVIRECSYDEVRYWFRNALFVNLYAYYTQRRVSIIGWNLNAVHLQDTLFQDVIHEKIQRPLGRRLF